MSVGPHKAVFEYDGLYICLDCHSRWGVHVLDYPKEAPGACLAGPAGRRRGAGGIRLMAEQSRVAEFIVVFVIAFCVVCMIARWW
jgi:hypothetical protein